MHSFLIDSGYTDARLKEIGLTKTPWHGSEMRPLLPYLVAEESALQVLIQLFFFGEAVSSNLIAQHIPTKFAEKMLASGMVHKEAEDWIPDCMLTHFGHLLLACDSVRRVQVGVTQDLVLGVNTPTHVLANCMVRAQRAADVLDLGTGCGTLALLAADHGNSVFATDINERAIQFTEFNAALNGIGNITALAGDRFEPVKDQRFDLIICNPPFFLTPKSELLFTENPFSLDSFVESLARRAPALLRDGGYYQMLCEWVETNGQPWRERLQNWFSNSGCDVLVLKTYEISPAKYTMRRSAESASLHGAAGADTLIEHLTYFEDQGVKRIYGGLVTIRKRPSNTDHWFVVEEMEEVPTSPVGDLVLNRFAAEDVLMGGDERLLLSKPRLSKDVALMQEAAHEGRTWKPKTTYLERRGRFPRRLGFSTEIAQLVALWDGSQDLNFLIGAFARQKNLQKKQLAPDCLRLARRLAEMGLITFAD